MDDELKFVIVDDDFCDPEFMEQEVLIGSEEALRYEIRRLMAEGTVGYRELFDLLYPSYAGHYSKLRAIIAEEKHYA